MAVQLIPPNRKVIRAEPDSNAAIVVDAERLILAGNREKFLVVDRSGIYLKGGISIVNGSQSVRYGGMWSSLPDIMRMFPSTIVTPIPARIPSPPIEGVLNLKDIVATLASVL